MCRDREVQREGTYETRASQRRMWHGLIQIVRTPYRPELHYMRGPGPKWYAKHQGHTENGEL